MNADDINNTLDRLSRADAAEWLESGKATCQVRQLAIAYDIAQIAINEQEREIAILRGRLADAELEILNRVRVIAVPESI